MTAQRAYEIRCDGQWADGDPCTRARSDYGSAADVRRDAVKYEGWAVNLPGGRDLCGDHRGPTDVGASTAHSNETAPPVGGQRGA